jgi:hypothetical protein
MPSSESDEFEVIDQLEASFSPEELSNVQAWLQPTDYKAQSSEFHRHLFHKLLEPVCGSVRLQNTKSGRSQMTTEVCGSKESLELGNR